VISTGWDFDGGDDLNLKHLLFDQPPPNPNPDIFFIAAFCKACADHRRERFFGTDDHRFNERKFPIKFEVPYRQVTAGYRCASALHDF
jgi:hypothetical protein